MKGYTLGSGYAYGLDNLPYPLIQRNADGQVAFLPTGVCEPFDAQSWLHSFTYA